MCLAVPVKIVTILEEENLGLRRGKVDFCGIRKEVCLDYTPEARVWITDEQGIKMITAIDLLPSKTRRAW